MSLATAHRYALRVYYADTDSGGVVYHANYLRFAECARTEALRDAGVPHADMVERFAVMFMVHRAEIDYVRPALLDDLLTVETATTNVGGASVRLRQTVNGPNGICAVIHIKLACVQNATGKAARIPPQWRDALAAMRGDDAQAQHSSGAGRPAPGPRIA